MSRVIFQIGNNIGDAIYEKYVWFAQFTPYILGAIAVFLAGWIVAEVVARGIIAMANGLKLEVISEKIGLKNFLKRFHANIAPSEVIAKGLKGYLIFIFFIEATKVARLTRVAEFLTEVRNYIPDLIVAFFIMLVGIRFANFLKLIITTSLSFTKSSAANVLGLAIKGTVITFTILAAIAQLQIAPILVQILFIGFVSMLALAGGLAFGLGGKDVVKEVLEAIKRMEIKELQKK